MSLWRNFTLFKMDVKIQFIGAKRSLAPREPAADLGIKHNLLQQEAKELSSCALAP